MISISLCMIVKNEEDTIGRCIESVRDCIDEVIIVDTGSIDRTKEVLRKYNVKLYNLLWQDDFAKARNYSFSKATKDYIFWMDADDILKEEDRKKFLELKETLDKSVDSVTMNYLLGSNNMTILKRNRVVKRSNHFKWIGRIHEYLEVYGNIVNSDISIIHKKEKKYTDRNLRIYEKMISEGLDFSPRDKFYYANELYYNSKLDEAIKEYKIFLEEGKGWIEDNKVAYKRIADCYSMKKDEKNELLYLFKSLECGKPNSDVCCMIGEKFFEKNDYDTAIFWYELAVKVKPEEDSLAISDKSYYTWIPYLQLCVCYSRLGRDDIANEYNEKAAEIVPNHSSVIYNRRYFSGRL